MARKLRTSPPPTKTADKDKSSSLVVAWIDPDINPFTKRNFDSPAALSQDGRTVVVSGRLNRCERREKTAEVQVTVVQDSTLASAGGSAELICNEGESPSFEIEATADEGKPAFEEGPAMACGVAVSRKGTKVIDYLYWCAFITLVGE